MRDAQIATGGCDRSVEREGEALIPRDGRSRIDRPGVDGEGLDAASRGEARLPWMPRDRWER